jgi:hypothetical protein
MAEGYELDADAVRRIFRAVRAWEAGGGIGDSFGEGPGAGGIIPQPPWEFGKVITSAISVGGSGTVEIYTSTDGATFTTTSDTRTVYASPLLTTGTIAVGKYVRIGYHSRSALWYVIAYEC